MTPTIGDAMLLIGVGLCTAWGAVLIVLGLIRARANEQAIDDFWETYDD
jgi:hypothetical protein